MAYAPQRWARRTSEQRQRSRARRLAQYAIEIGLLVPLDECQMCRQRVPLHAHHPDYAKPLAVIFLCEQCHHLVHTNPAAAALWGGQVRTYRILCACGRVRESLGSRVQRCEECNKALNRKRAREYMRRRRGTKNPRLP